MSWWPWMEIVCCMCVTSYYDCLLEHTDTDFLIFPSRHTSVSSLSYSILSPRQTWWGKVIKSLLHPKSTTGSDHHVHTLACPHRMQRRHRDKSLHRSITRCDRVMKVSHGSLVSDICCTLSWPWSDWLPCNMRKLTFKQRDAMSVSTRDTGTESERAEEKDLWSVVCHVGLWLNIPESTFTRCLPSGIWALECEK